MVMTRSQQIRVGFPQRNLYTMDVNKSQNRNCYNCGGFRYLARNCNNRRIGRTGDGRKIDIGRNRQNNLNEREDLIVFD